MKKISILCVVIALAMTMGLGIGTCFAAGNYDPVELFQKKKMNRFLKH